ncbi:hypothetical protein ACKI1H_27180 [Pseudomonas sp. YH-1]|uniref:hypothetical protein n=1 Tax=Pseudomonas sp. YH-1 TaxID=3384787 RepID=UPI003F7DBB8E
MLEGLDLVDRLIELQVVDGRETEIRLWLTHDDKVAIFDAVEKYGARALENVTKGGVTLYSREVQQAVGHDAKFLEAVFLSEEAPSKANAIRYIGPDRILLAWADQKYPDSPIPAIDSYSPFADRAKYQTPGMSIGASRVIYGNEFVATMQLRTPLKVLEQHGRIERCEAADLPRIIKARWEGIWGPKTSSFRSLGIDIDDFPQGSMASEIGQIDADGGDLLRFLILVKRIAQCDTDRIEKADLMLAASSLCGTGGHSFDAFMSKWGGPGTVLDRLA